jgi:hypothetical protein
MVLRVSDSVHSNPPSLKKEDVDILIQSYFLKTGWARKIKILNG